MWPFDFDVYVPFVSTSQGFQGVYSMITSYVAARGRSRSAAKRRRSSCLAALELGRLNLLDFFLIIGTRKGLKIFVGFCKITFLVSKEFVLIC